MVFTQGCNLRCPYCHNPELLPTRCDTPNLEAEAKQHLEKRKDVLDGVVVTGGEPTLQRDLADFLRFARSLGLQTKLDTNGTRPDQLKALLEEESLDYVAMDVKLPQARYGELGATERQAIGVRESWQILRRFGVEHEVRLTAMKPFLGSEDLDALREELEPGDRIALQAYVPGRGLDPEFEQNNKPLEPQEIKRTAARLASTGARVVVRA